MILKSWNVEADKGINYASYDLKIDKSKKSKYEKWLTDQSKNKKSVEIEPGKYDDAIYIQPGKYEVEVSANGKVSKQKLVIE